MTFGIRVWERNRTKARTGHRELSSKHIAPIMANRRYCRCRRPSRTFILTLAIGITLIFSFTYNLMNIRILIWNRLSLFFDDLYDVIVDLHNNEEQSQLDDDRVAQVLATKVRVLCWIMTYPANHHKKARHVKATWGRRCNIILFMSSETDPKLPAIGLNMTGEGRDYLWEKTKLAFLFVYKHYLNEADWFLKADDDTYVIVENLRYLLMSSDPADPIYFGCKFRRYVQGGYMTGGPGYVLSREALKRFVEDAIPNPQKCRSTHGGAEDIEVARCLQEVGVIGGDSRDSLGRGRFFDFTAEYHLIPGRIKKNSWYWMFTYYPSEKGFDCCSDTTISFHYVEPHMMYILEFLIYHLKPYGIHRRFTSENWSIQEKDST